MKAVLISPPIPHITTTTSPPVGLAYLASVLIDKGIEPVIISSDAEGLDVSSTVEKAIDLKPDLVLISATTPTTNNGLKIIAKIKAERNQVRILAGGPHPTL